MTPPEYVSSDSIVTAAQWSALAEYMRWVYTQLPQSCLISAGAVSSSTSLTSSFTSGTVIYHRSGGTAYGITVPVMSTGVASGFASRGYGASQNQASCIPVPYVISPYVYMPSSTAYFSQAYYTAGAMCYEGTWMEDA